MIRNYLSLVKFSHTIFALPFALIGFFLATAYHNYEFHWTTLLKVVLCMIFARSAAMAFNRWADRNIDQLNPRTAIREIPAGIIKGSSAIWFIILNCSLFVLITWFINPLCFYLSPVALCIILGYSYTKRFTSLCHFILGLGLSLAPIGAYLSVTETFHILPIFYSVVVLFWVSGFDIIYALQDDDFDKENNLFSVPVGLGKKNALLLSSAIHVVCAAFLVIAGLWACFGIWYWAGSIVFIFLLAYQHTLVKPHDLSKVNLAFFATNGIASLVFAIFMLAELFISI